MQVNPTNLSIYEVAYIGSKLLDKLDEMFNKNLKIDKYTNIQLDKNKRNSLIKYLAIFFKKNLKNTSTKPLLEISFYLTIKQKIHNWLLILKKITLLENN